MKLNDQYTYSNFKFLKGMVDNGPHKCEYCKIYNQQKIYIAFELLKNNDQVYIYFYCDDHFPYKDKQTDLITGYLYEIIKFYKTPFDNDEIIKFAKTLCLLE